MPSELQLKVFFRANCDEGKPINPPLSRCSWRGCDARADGGVLLIYSWGMYGFCAAHRSAWEANITGVSFATPLYDSHGGLTIR